MSAQARTVGRASAQGGLAHGQHRGRQWTNPADSSQLAYSSICPGRSQSRVSQVDPTDGAESNRSKGENA